MPNREAIKEQFRDSFERADTEGTGKLTKDQVGLMIGTAEVQPDPKHINMLFNLMDIDRSGTVDLDEFTDAMVMFEDMFLGYSLIRMRFLFDKYDVDKSGIITKADLMQLAKDDPSVGLDEATITAFISNCDMNGDGKISFDEFAKAMATD